jgi:lipoprotein-anchoring transpeptidase ErfK/SrfK
MSRVVSVGFAWLIALTLAFTPVVMFSPQNAAAQSTTEDASPTVDATEPDATEIPATSVDTATPQATETVAAPTDVATEIPSDTATAEATATEVATEAPATDVPTVEATAAAPSETVAPSATATATKAAKTATPAKDSGFGPAVVADLQVTVSCVSDPETIRVTNTGIGNITLTGISTYVDPLASEPFSINRVLKPGQTAIYQAGHAAQYGTVLTTNYIFTNSAYDLEGVRIASSVGEAVKMCEPKPAPPLGNLGDLKVTLDCLSTAETIRVSNNGTGWITVKGFASFIDTTADEPIAVSRVLKPGQTGIFQAGDGAKYGTILTKKYIFTNAAYEKDGIRISTNVGKIQKACPAKPIPPERWIEVNLSTQYLRAWVGSTVVNGTYVSTGKDGFETPTGTYYILYRYRYQTMAGCIQGECYNVPDVPWVQYFTNYGHALHGAYWHNDFGILRRSHGCVNLPLGFAAWLWDWATYGTRVWIHY